MTKSRFWGKLRKLRGGRRVGGWMREKGGKEIKKEKKKGRELERVEGVILPLL